MLDYLLDDYGYPTPPPSGYDLWELREMGYGGPPRQRARSEETPAEYLPQETIY